MGNALHTQPHLRLTYMNVAQKDMTWHPTHTVQYYIRRERTKVKNSCWTKGLGLKGLYTDLARMPQGTIVLLLGPFSLFGKRRGGSLVLIAVFVMRGVKLGD